MVSGYHFDKSHKLQNEVDEIRLGVANLNKNYHFQDRTAFERGVANTIEKLVEKKRLENIAQKYKGFDLAEEKIKNEKRIYGNPDARFTLVEFSDLECGYCKRFHDTPRHIVDASKGKINWQWMHLPLKFHNPTAKMEALAAECVAEQKGNRGFWVFINDIFQNTKGNGAGVSNITDMANDVGADVNQFKNCLVSGRHKATIEKNIDKATENNVNSTPTTFVVDNVTGRTQILNGMQPPEAVIAVIRMMMAEAKSKASGKK